MMSLFETLKLLNQSSFLGKEELLAMKDFVTQNVPQGIDLFKTYIEAAYKAKRLKYTMIFGTFMLNALFVWINALSTH